MFENILLQKNINENEKEKGSEEASMNGKDCTLIDNQEKNELLPYMEKQLSDCDVVETSKEEELVGSERYRELVKKINFTHLDSTKIHFLAGLRNSKLQTLARMNKHLDFDELLEYLEDEVVQIEYMRKNRNKVESLRSA